MLNPYKYIKEEPYKLYINGEFVTSESRETMDAINPVNNKVFAKMYKGGEKDVEKAIKAARHAFDNGPWGKMTNLQRSKLLCKFRDILEKNKKNLHVLKL